MPLEITAFQAIYATYLLALLAWDRFFLRKGAGPSFKLLIFVITVAGFFALFPKALIELSQALGVGRAVDLVFYLLIPVLIRELFASRRRIADVRKVQTRIIREMAKRNPKL